MDQEGIINSARLSIWLDTYDDIFSDFDSRDYQQRALSDDFIHEARKMVKEKPDGQVELKLLMPEELRNENTEEIIAKSVHRQFSHFAQVIKTEMKNIRLQGFLMCATGFILMIVAAYLTTLINKIFYISALQVIIEPAGWFLVWTGFDHIFNSFRKRSPEYIFNKKMAESDIIFLSI
jgi:hypothetical protein